ncbi:MAG: carboxypeptidase-like regulatory domain-containing protein, partial [Pyrinomonadaceae bacterium]
MIKKASMFLATLALLGIFVTSASAQLTGGRVTGSVVDQNAAAISAATVNLRNKATGQTLTTQTESGAFNFPNALPGDYEITIEASGFQSITQVVTVVLNQESAVNATLQAGGVGNVTVDVTASSEALVQTDSSQLGRTFSTQLVQNLPIFGSQNQLALLSPNVADRSGGVLGSGGSVGGTRPRGNVFTVDGVDNNDPSVTGPVAGVIQDAVGEFTLLQNTYNAEFGGGGGGQFVTVTRSGTNEFHGSGFVYGQHQRLNAASTAEESQLQSGEISVKPRFRNTRYGMTLGGPIVKNKLFFFGALERTHNSTGGSGEAFLAPTAPGLAQLFCLPGVRPCIVNLLQNNVTLATAETDRVDVFGASIPVGQVAVNVPAGFFDKSYQLNIDYNRGSTDSFRFRYNTSDFSQEQAGLGSPLFNNFSVAESRLFSTTWVRNISSNVVNNLRLSDRRLITDAPLVNAANLAFPNITVEPLSLQIGPQGNLPQSGADNVYQVFDALTYIRGKHNFKFGAEFRRTLTNSIFLSRGRGDYLYSDFETLLLDLPPEGRDGLRGVGNGANVLNFSTYNFFVQDDWRVRPNLTLNLG